MVEAVDEAAEGGHELKAVLLRAGNELFAVDALSVVEVVVRGPVTPVPYSARHFVGLCVVAGRLLPVSSLRMLLDVPVGEPAMTLPRLVILSDGDAEVAFACEEAVGVRTLGYSPSAGEGRLSTGVADWNDTEVIVLDVPQLIEEAMAHTKEGER